MATVQKKAVINISVQDKEAVKRLADIQKSIGELQAKQAKLNMSTEAGRLSSAKYAEQIKALRAEHRAVSKDVQKNIALNNAHKSSIDAMKLQLQQLTDQYTKLSKAQRGTNAGNALGDQVNQLAAEIKELEAVYKTSSVYSGGNAAAVAAIAGSYESLSKRHKAAAATAAEIGAKFGITSNQFQVAAANARLLAEELTAIDKATRKTRRSVDSSNYSLFTLTQVMRELPNFAIDARIGFMSLSNNLPMLSQAFSDLAKQQGSTKKAFSMMARSLLSVNTIMVIASTLLVMYGKDLVKFVQGTDAAADAQKKLNKSIKDGSFEYSNNVESMLKLKMMFDAAKRGVLDKDAVLREYNKTLGETTGQTDDLSEAERRTISNTDVYIKAMFLRAKSNEMLAMSAQLAIKAESMRDSLADPIKPWERAYEFVKKFTTAQGLMLMSLSADELAMLERHKKLNKTEAEYEKTLASAQKAMADMLDFFKENGLDYFGSDAIAQGLSIQAKAARKYVTEMRIAQRELAEIASNTERFGVRTDYDERTEAAKAWLANEKLIAEELYSTEIDRIAETVVTTQKSLDDKLAKSKNYARAKVDYDEAMAVVNANAEADAAKAHEDYLDRKAQADEQYRAWEYGITSDRIDEHIRLLEELQAQELQGLDDARAIALLKLQEEYKVNYGLSKSLKERRILTKQFKADMNSLDAFYAAESIEMQKKHLQDQLALEALSDEDRRALRSKLAALELKALAAKNAAEIEQNAAKIAVIEEQERQSLADREAILRTALAATEDLIGSYYDNAHNKLTASNSAEMAALDEQYSKRRISKRRYEAEKKKLDKKAFEDEKKLKVQQALIEAALGAVRIWASAKPTTVKIAESVALATTTAANVMVIRKAKYARRGMLLQGPTHEAGGIPVEAEGGEAIINARSTSMFRKELSMINEAGGGVAFANGGIPGLSNDGGYSTRSTTNSVAFGITPDQIRAIVESIKVYTAISDIRKADKDFTKIEGNSRF